MLMANKKPACASTEHHQDTNFCTIPPLPQLCTLCPKQNTTEMDYYPIKSEFRVLQVASRPASVTSGPRWLKPRSYIRLG